MATKSAAMKRRQRHEDEDVIVTEPAVRYKDDYLDGLEVQVDQDKDFISSLPTETLHSILSYLVLDHDPDRGVKIDAHQSKSYGFAEQPHVLLSLSTISRHFQANVESFSRHHLTMYRHTYDFKANNDTEKDCRRSLRLAAKPRSDHRVYRMELVKHIQTRCFKCNAYCTRRATMANGVACCLRTCEDRAFSDVIGLTDALRDHDLRDYMLLKTRQPGPRAKHTDLPTIAYGTARIGMGYGRGMCVSYRFFKRDVEMIARLVHGDVGSHMKEKHKRLRERKNDRLRKLHIELKIRFHSDRLDKAQWDEDKEYHQDRLEHFKDPEWDGNWRSSIEDDWDYGGYDDVHQRICKISTCDDCLERRAHRYCCYY